VSAAGDKITTAFAVTEAQALTSNALVFILTVSVVACIEGMQRVEMEYKEKHVPRDEAFLMQLIDFFMSELGNEEVNEFEGAYIAQDRYRTIMEQQYLSALQEMQGRSLGPNDISDALAQFRDGVAGSVAPYVEDEG
jgi:hypothetical protein